MIEKTNYNIQWFISKYEKIPEEQWTVNKFGEGGLDKPLKYCALGHLQTDRGEPDKAQQHALFNILRNPASINDGKLPEYQQQTPKLRILAALRKQLEYQKYNRN